MKKIEFTKIGVYDTQTVMLSTLRVPGRGMDLEEMRRRCKVLEKLEKANGHLLLEDADFDVVKQALATNSYGMANIELLAIIDAILASKDPPEAST
jgi:hypothetical protein